MHDIYHDRPPNAKHSRVVKKGGQQAIVYKSTALVLDFPLHINQCRSAIMHPRMFQQELTCVSQL